MKKLSGLIADSYCRRPFLWLTLLLLAAIAQEMLLFSSYPAGYDAGTIVLDCILELLTGSSLAASVVFPAVLASINLFFLLAHDPSGDVRKAGAETELFSIIYSGAFACVHASGVMVRRDDYSPPLSDSITVLALLCAVPLVTAAAGYAVVRRADGSVRTLSRRALRTMLATEMFAAAACLICATLSLFSYPGWCVCSVCLAIVAMKLFREVSSQLKQSFSSDAAPPEQHDEESESTCEPVPEAEPAQKRSPRLSAAVLVAVLAAVVLFAIPLILSIGMGENLSEAAFGGLTLLLFGGLFLLLPGLLTLFNIVRLFLRDGTESARLARLGRVAEAVTLVWGFLCTLIWADLGISNIVWKDWHEQLYNAERHSPVATWTMPTVAVLMLVSLAGYLVLRLSKPEKLPPLAAALSIAALYIGSGVSVMWILQVAWRDMVICLLSFNMILVYARVIRDAVIGWRRLNREAPEHRSAVIRFLARIVNNSLSWPLLGLVLALPLLGIIIALLTLFGQAPDSIIQAWTQTADWSFSQQIGPPNLHYDEHYLCTVAAGGHKRVVRPLRKGRRHGHEVTVNRQLCVANAFEQLIEERAPRFHSVVRGLYDRYGYPVARHIKTPLAADVVWVLMKPLEWLFLAVLYLFDAKPENRIAVQYPHAPLPDINAKDE